MKCREIFALLFRKKIQSNSLFYASEKSLSSEAELKKELGNCQKNMSFLISKRLSSYFLHVGNVTVIGAEKKKESGCRVQFLALFDAFTLVLVLFGQTQAFFFFDHVWVKWLCGMGSLTLDVNQTKRRKKLNSKQWRKKQ